MEKERLLMCLCLPVRVKGNGAVGGGGGGDGGAEGWGVLVASSECVYFCAHALY